jgi:hypothetical protein
MPPQSHSNDEVNFLDTLPVMDGTGDHKSPCDNNEDASRSVKFSTSVEIHRIPHHRDMSDDEINRVWMNRSEMRQNKRVVSNTVFLMKSGVGSHLTEEDYFCSRGLEHWVDDEHEGRVKTSHKIALAMQRILKRAGSSNPEMIARAYRKYTFKSQRAARKKAMHDQAAVCR